MSKVLDDFNEFSSFCFEHGDTLMYHKRFGELARLNRANVEELVKDYERLKGLVEPDKLKSNNNCPTCGTNLIGSNGRWCTKCKNIKEIVDVV